MLDRVRWGIFGTGDIARQMAEDLALVPNAKLMAVASRDRARAEAFAAAHEIPLSFDSYDALARSDAVDLIYVATPHSRHCDDTLLAIAHGKGVLCEKPMAPNADEVERMISAARERNVFLMEAMWSFYFPAMREAMRVVHAGEIGRPRMVTADFSYRAHYDPEHRLFNPALAGGALLDIGVYPIALADRVYQAEPDAVVSYWTPAASGVDAGAVILLAYPGGGRALLSTSLEFNAPQQALIVGEEGSVRLPDRFSQPDTVVVERADKVTTRRFARKGYGYHLEAQAATECLRRGETESATAPWDASLRVARVVDRIRAEWRLHAPAKP